MKKEYANKHRADSSDSGPYGIDRAERKRLGSLCHQVHTQSKSDSKAAPP